MKNIRLTITSREKANSLLLILLIGFYTSSCVTQKDVEYIHDIDKTPKSYPEPATSEYKLKPKDDLFIQISSLDDAAANIFSGTNSEGTTFISSIEPYGAYLLSYTIDPAGNLNLPYIGQLFVKDKTIGEVTQMLKDSLENILSYPAVSIKLVNRYLSVLGEVLHPGHYAFAQEKMTIYDALGLAGDISEYGNRREVTLIRNEEGVNKRFIINLTDPAILTSEQYYIKPNDLIYVEPLHRKFWNLRQFPYEILSTLVTAILIYSVR